MSGVIEGSRRVLVKVMHFQLGRRGHPQDDAMFTFFPDSKIYTYGLSNDVIIFFWIFSSPYSTSQNVSLKIAFTKIYMSTIVTAERVDSSLN